MPVSFLTSRFVALTLTMVMALTTVAASGEDGTSGSLPKLEHGCTIIAAQYGAADLEPAASPVASPVIEVIGTPMASPVAAQTATPVASPVTVANASPVASPVTAANASPIASPVVEVQATPVLSDEEILSNDLAAASNAILDCMSANDPDALTTLTGEKFRGSWLGFGGKVSDSELETILPFMPELPYQLMSVENARVAGDTASATIVYTAGRQVQTSEWSFKLATRGDMRFWQVQDQKELVTTPDTNAKKVILTIENGSFSLSENTVPAGNVTIEVANKEDQPHEALIVRTPGAVTAADFAAATNGLPEGSTYIGQMTVPAGGSGTIVLSDLRDGTYTIVDMLPNDLGLPNVSDGMIISFTVGKP